MNKSSLAQYDLKPDSLRLNLPDGPGVYLFKDRSGQVVYVGKAKNLKKRVLSYFRPSAELPQKTALMMNKVKGLGSILTA
ncbi:MAG: GIY-YIG nuclease family protein, partial [Desulfatiglandales bacterium]|nr:GIY-YIG nuclease family protein [Desulfatiglandales bacterium]